MKIRKAGDRGATQIGWLDSRHTFSFGEYTDREHMGYRSLRVINDDRVAAGQGFGAHGHRDMEIISIVLEGQLEHKDSLGHGQVLVPGEVQVMTAGRGIRHSEFNPSSTESAHFLQVWIMPEQIGVNPAYAQKPFPRSERLNQLRRVAGARGSDDGAITINQNAHLYLLGLTSGGRASFDVAPGRGVWVHVATGGALVNGTPLSAGDGASVEGPSTVSFEGTTDDADLLVFDLQ